MSLERMRVLLVEDNPGDARLIRLYLAEAGAAAFDLAHADRLAEGIRRAREGDFDVVLLDLSLPDASGLEAITKMHEAVATCPIVVLTGLNDEAVALEAVRKGAQDYLVKDQISSALLVRAMRYAIERERTEQALRQTKEALEAIITASPAAVLSLDTEGRILTWNESAEHIFGWTASEAVGRLPPFIPADRKAGFETLLRQVLAGETLSGIELPQQRKDGTPIDVSLSTGLMHGPDGRVTGIVEVLADVTERKQAEAELAAQAERTKILFEYAPDAFYVSDFHGTFLDGNRAAEQLLGYPREELVGASFLKLNLLPASELTKAAGLLVRSALGQATGPDELVLHRKDGTMVSVEICTHVVTIHGRKVVLGSARDITERRRTETALRESDKRFRELFDSMSSGVAVYETRDQGASFVFKDFNQGAERIDSLRREDVVGRNVQQVFPGIEEFGLLAVLRRVWQTGRPERHPVGRYEDDRISGWRENYVYRLASGEVVTVYDDVTARMQAEAALHESEEKYRLVVDNAGEAILVVQDGKLVFTNPRTSEIIGYPHEKLLGRSFVEFIHPDDRALVADRYRRRILGEDVPVRYEFRVVRRDGETRQVEINAVRIDWMGRPATLNFLPDVTERKRTEEKIEQLSRFPEENPDPVLRVAADGELMYANAGSRLLLLTLQCEVGQRMTESWQERVRDTLTSNSPNSVAEVTCGDKTYSLTLAPVASAGYVNVYGRDITERQQAEVALRKSEARLQEAQALGRTGNWEFDLDSQKIEWSDETYRLYERDKPLGPPTLEEEASYYSHDEVLRLRGFARQATEEGRDLSYDLTANLPSGRTVFFSASMRPVKDETGRVVKLFGTMHDITDRKQAEAALRESEEKYRLVIDTAGEAILVAQDAKMVFTNPRTSEMTGYTREELLGRSFIEFIHPDDRTLVADRYRRRIAGEHVPDRYDFRIVGRGGETHQVEINAVRIDWMGRPATLNFLADVTERKQAEEEIAQAKLRLEYLFKSSPVVIYTAAGSADSGATFISGNVVALIGFEPSDFLDDPGFWLDHIHPEDRDRVVAELPQMFKQPSYVHEYRFRKKDGDYIWVRDEVRVLRDARGEPVEVIGSWSDVTERRRAEEALRTSEAQLSNAMEIARLGYWEYDVADDLFTFNDHFYDVFRTTAEKVGGYKMSSAQYAGRFVHPDDVAVVGAETRKAIETTDPHFSRQLEHRIIYADGSVGHISVRFFIIKDSQGRTVKTYGANQDITERKLAEAEIAQKNAQLVELNDVKNQLLGMAAHDLRNPLSVVSTASAFLLDDAGRLLPEAKRTDFLRRINSSSEFMLRMIDDLLDVAKIEAGRLDLELATGDLCGLIEENLTMNRMLAERKGIRLDFAPECNVPPFRFDRGKVEQVLNNLISNALKFSASGTAVTVQVSRVNGSVVVSVRDQGSGIPTKELDKLFKPFGTTSVRGTAGEKSTGLGLAICRKIAEGHHGRIWAESEVGKGSVFSFSLPVPAPA